MQKQKFAHWEFEELLKEPDNQMCFDCGKTPAQWASVNNGVYLCINCSGNHRGYGVNISYVRSLTLDKWNDNQIGLMKVGGNKKLKELLDIYKVDKNKIDKEKLYSSNLLEFYRHVLKSKEANEPNSKEAPSQEDALKSSINFNLNDNNNNNSNVNNEQNKFGSVGSESNNVDDKESFSNLLNGWMTKFVDGTKNIANKVGEMEIGKKIVNTGSKISGAVLDKGTQITQSNVVQSFAKKANDSLNFIINSIFGSKKQEEGGTNTNNDNKEKVENESKEEHTENSS